MALPYPTKVVLPFDIATAQDMNERHANDVALAAGTGLNDGAVKANKIDFTTLPKPESVIADGSTTLSSATPVSTGVSVSLTVPASGKVEVSLSAQLTTPNAANGGAWASVALTGANTISAQDDIKTALIAVTPSAGILIVASARTYTLEGLTPGSTTFTVWGWREGSSGSGNIRRINLTARPIQ